MGDNVMRLTAVATLMVSACATATHPPQDATAWLNDRQARYAAYRKAHADPDAELAGLKVRTAAMVAADSPPRSVAAAGLGSTPTRTAGDDPDADRPPVIWRTSTVALPLWDRPDAPEMVVVPAGEYTMGSPLSEPNRVANEGPRHRVRIAYAFAVSKYPITVGEFGRFVAETGYDAGDSCLTYEDSVWKARDGRNWRTPGIDQTTASPAVCLNWNDAQAYATWLSNKTGHDYRLLTEAEYEYANRAGATTAYWWGDDVAAACAHANTADAALKSRFQSYMTATTCDDGFAYTSPVGHFAPNAFGLYDTTGNIWTWIEDCWSDSYAASPRDGSANLNGDCSRRQRRGGSWGNNIQDFRSAIRTRSAPGNRGSTNGIRVARNL